LTADRPTASAVIRRKLPSNTRGPSRVLQ
jgi:hypothetical protein